MQTESDRRKEKLPRTNVGGIRQLQGQNEMLTTTSLGIYKIPIATAQISKSGGGALVNISQTGNHWF